MFHCFSVKGNFTIKALFTRTILFDLIKSCETQGRNYQPPTFLTLIQRNGVFQGHMSRLVTGSRTRAARLRPLICVEDPGEGPVSHRVKLSSCRLSTRLSAVR